MKSFSFFCKIVALSFVLFLGLVVAANAQDKPAKHHCEAITKAGTQCQHYATGQYCKQHDPNTAKCGVPTKSGKPCSRTVKNQGDKCFQHKTN